MATRGKLLEMDPTLPRVLGVDDRLVWRNKFDASLNSLRMPHEIVRRSADALELIGHEEDYRLVMTGTLSGQWPEVVGAATDNGIPFLLFCGSVIVQRKVAQEHGIHSYLIQHQTASDMQNLIRKAIPL